MAKVSKSKLKAIRYQYYLKSLRDQVDKTPFDKNVDAETAYALILDANLKRDKKIPVKPKKSIQDLRKHLGFSADKKEKPYSSPDIKKIDGLNIYYRYGYYKEGDFPLAKSMTDKGFITIHGHHDISGEEMLLYVKANTEFDAIYMLEGLEPDLDRIHFSGGHFDG